MQARVCAGRSRPCAAMNYTVIDEVRKLPLKVSDIYRRLTG